MNKEILKGLHKVLKRVNKMSDLELEISYNTIKICTIENRKDWNWSKEDNALYCKIRTAFRAERARRHLLPK